MMRKLVPLFLILMLLSLSIVSFAGGYGGPGHHNPWKNYDEHVDDDGIVTWTRTSLDNKYVNIPWIDRTGYQFDENDATKGQAVEVTLQTWAFIPCYLEMKVTGNQGQTMVKSYGPGVEATAAPTSYVLAFDNEIGGFVDERWNSLGHGRYAEVGFNHDEKDIYIQGCDVFKVEIYANDNYKYEVKAGPLSPTDAIVDSKRAKNYLPLQMRSGFDIREYGRTYTFDQDGTVYEIVRKKACESTTVYHQFRVPYSRNIAHGRYDGTVTFRAVTL